MKHILDTITLAAARRMRNGTARVPVAQCRRLMQPWHGARLLRLLWSPRRIPFPSCSEQCIPRGVRSYGQLQPGFLGNSD